MALIDDLYNLTNTLYGDVLKRLRTNSSATASYIPQATGVGLEINWVTPASIGGGAGLTEPTVMIDCGSFMEANATIDCGSFVV